MDPRKNKHTLPVYTGNALTGRYPHLVSRDVISSEWKGNVLDLLDDPSIPVLSRLRTALSVPLMIPEEASKRLNVYLLKYLATYFDVPNLLVAKAISALSSKTPADLINFSKHVWELRPMTMSTCHLPDKALPFRMIRNALCWWSYSDGATRMWEDFRVNMCQTEIPDFDNDLLLFLRKTIKQVTDKGFVSRP